jgi:hypothetical protein
MESSIGCALDSNGSTTVCMMTQILPVNQIGIYTLIYLILWIVLLLAVLVVVTTQTIVMKTGFSTKNITMISKLKYFVSHIVINYLETGK